MGYQGGNCSSPQCAHGPQSHLPQWNQPQLGERTLPQQQPEQLRPQVVSQKQPMRKETTDACLCHIESLLEKMQAHLVGHIVEQGAKLQQILQQQRQTLETQSNQQLPAASPLPHIHAGSKVLMTRRSHSSTDSSTDHSSHQHTLSEDVAPKATALAPEGGDLKLVACIDEFQSLPTLDALSPSEAEFAPEGLAEEGARVEHGHSTTVLGGRKTAHDVHIPDTWNEGTESRISIATCVKHRYFEHAIGVTILVNYFIIILQADFSVRNPGKPDSVFFKVTEFIFFLVFAAELVLRLYVFRCGFFIEGDYHWNWFDAIIVTTALVELVVNYVAEEISRQSVTWLRILRIIKLSRLIRVIRVVRVFRELRIMVMSIVSTLRTLLWSLVCVILIMSSIACYFAWLVADHLDSNSESDSEVVKEVVKYFGSIPRIMMSLFKATTGGTDWADLSDLLCPISLIACCIFYAYISMMVFAIMNILTGICVNNANKAADDDLDLCTEDMLKNDDVVMLRKILAGGRKSTGSLSSLDPDTGGKFTWAQVRVHLGDPKTRACFKKIGLEVWHLRSFFDLLKVGDEEPEVDVDQFIRGCMRLRCNVKNIDLMAALHENREYETRRCKELKRSITEVCALVSELQQSQELRSAVPAIEEGAKHEV